MVLDWLDTTLLVIGGLLFYRFWPRIWRAMKNFDAENHQRINQEREDRRDSLAHYRHAMDVAGEQVEDIGEIVESDPRTGTRVTRYLFEGTRYAKRAEAEAVRAEKIGAIARGFYRELPRALIERRGKDKLS